MSQSNDDYVIVVRKRQPTPTWLSEYQRRLTEANHVAAAATTRLTGERRVRLMNQIVRIHMKRAKEEGRPV